MWFALGPVMMYVAFPRLTDRERLAALPEIAWEQGAYRARPGHGDRRPRSLSA